MKTVLVTGGFGFIGANFVQYLIANTKYNVIVFDKVTYAANKDNLKDVINKVDIVFGDITNQKDLNTLNDVDIIVNFAAETHVDRAIKDASNFIKTNVFGVYNLLELARRIDVKKFVQISTDEVYGSRESGYFKETDRLTPRNPYSATKAAGDHLAYSYFNTYGLPIVITRSSNNFGPYQNPEKFIPKTITNALLNKHIPVYGKGENIRDWLYVEDNCSGILTVLEKGKLGEIYNIGGDNEKKNIDVVKLVLNLLVRHSSLIDFVKDRSGHDFRYALNCDKLKQLGWQPKYNFEEGLKKTIGWYKNNKDLWSQKKNQK